MSQRSRAILGAVLLLVLTASAYFPVVSCGFIWDDDAYVERNGNLQGVRGLYRIWFDVTATPQYYPMVHTTYWFEYQLWELKPAGFHVTNVLLHWIAAVLLWRILSLLNVPGAWLIAAVFGLHPVHVESVAWITERKNVLSAVFYLGSALAYLRCKLGSGSRWLSTVSLLLFVAALLSKTVTATLPAALLLILWWKRERLCREDVRELLPFFALSLAFGMLTVWLEVHHVGALGDEWSLTFVERTLLAGKIVCFYIWKLLWPSNLAFIYERWNASFHSAWQLAFPAGVTAVLLTLLGLRNRLGRGPLVAVLFFIGTLFPALGFFDVYPMRYSFVADHFQYLASIGIIALVIGGAARLLSQAPRRLRSSGVVLAVVLLLNLALLTWRQISIYEGLETLWLDTLSKNPTCWMAHVNLGVYYQSNGRPDDAARNFESALEIQPAHAKAANNLGCVLATQSNFDGAILSFRNALAIDPEFTLAHYNLADALASIGDFRGSQQHYLQAAELDPSFASAHFKLGLIAYQEGRFNEAAARFRRTLELEPTHPRAADYLVRSAPH